MSAEEVPQPPLAGIRVVELAESTAAAITGMWLADFGADVLKVTASPIGPERPERVATNRGKRIVGGSEVDIGMVDDTDVLIVDSDERLAEWRVTAAELVARHPRLVVARVEGYEGSPPWVGGRESSGLLAAATGVSARQASPSGDPVESVYPTLLYMQGVWGASCTAAALLEREHSGRGQILKVTGVDAAAMLSLAQLTVDPDLPDVDTAVGLAGRHPTYTRVRCADEAWIAIGALGNRFAELTLEICEAHSVLKDPRIDGSVARIVLPENHAWVGAVVRERFAQRSSDEWIALLRGAGVPCGRVGSREEWLAHPQMRAIGMETVLEDGELGRIRTPGVPLVLPRSPAQLRPMDRSRGGRKAISAKVPTVTDPKPAVRPGPLTGYRVLVNGAFVATPFAGGLLAGLGADVVRVEPPGGDPIRTATYAFTRGTKSLALDLRRSEGQELFRTIAAHCDAVVSGVRPGQSQKHGIEYERLAQRHADLVQVTLSAYGQVGPMRQEPGVDMVIQAQSGMMTAQGGDGDPVTNTIASIDLVTAATISLGVVLGLYHVRRGGPGQEGWVSLAGVSGYMQLVELTEYEGAPSPPVGNAQYQGTDAWHRMYPTRDGWVRVDAEAGAVDAAALERALQQQPKTDDRELTEQLAQFLSPLVRRQAADRMNAMGVRTTPVRKISEFIRDPDLNLAGAFVTERADDGTYFTTAAKYVSFSRTNGNFAADPPGAGEHTLEVLEGVNIDPTRQHELVDENIVSVGGRVTKMIPVPYR